MLRNPSKFATSALVWVGKAKLIWATVCPVTEKSNSTDDFSYRDLYVGLKGDWGKFQLAQKAYGSFYNHVTGPVDQPYFIGGGGFIKTGRSENMISYMGGGDKFSFGVDIEADGTDATDVNGVNSSTSGFQAAASLGLGDNWTIAVGAADSEDSTVASNATNATVAGATVHGTIGDFFLAGTYQQDDDDTGIEMHAAFSNFFVHFAQRDYDVADITPTQIGIGYAQSIGENTTFWAEAQSVDSDGGIDSTEIVAALRYDII
jgi:predicted porin